MDKGFIKYVKAARREFVRDVDEQLWNTELRTSAENLIIAYDQMVSKLELCNCNESSNELNNGIKTAEIKIVSLPEWLSKERCVLAGSLWKSHQQGDNKRVKAVLLIKEWAADAGYKIDLKKAHELFEQHCL